MVGGHDERPAPGNTRQINAGDIVVGVHARLLQRLAEAEDRSWRCLHLGGLSFGPLDVGPRDVAFVNLFAAGGGERLLQRSEQIGVRQIDGEVDGLDRIGVEVVELPLIGDRVGAKRRASRAAHREVTHVRIGPGGRVIEGASDLVERALVFDDDALDVGRSMGRDPDLQRERRFEPTTREPSRSRNRRLRACCRG